MYPGFAEGKAEISGKKHKKLLSHTEFLQHLLNYDTVLRIDLNHDFCIKELTKEEVFFKDFIYQFYLKVVRRIEHVIENIFGKFPIRRILRSNRI